jgi:hypothetical protein
MAGPAHGERAARKTPSRPEKDPSNAGGVTAKTRAASERLTRQGPPARGRLVLAEREPEGTSPQAMGLDG